MSDFVCIGSLADIPPGEGRTFRVNGRMIAVFQTHAGEVFATQAACPHLHGPLSDGLVGGATIACPLHDRVFDMKTGCGLTHEKTSIATYPVTVLADSRISLSVPALHREVEMATG